MNNNKLATLLNTFSKNEMNRFRKFIVSPFFNENEKLVQLFDLIVLILEKPIQKQIFSKEKVWKKLYPLSVYNDVKYRRLNSDLLKLSFDFITHQKFVSQSFLKYNLQLSALQNIGLEKHFDGTLRQIGGQFEKKNFKNADYYYSKFQLNIEQDTFNKKRQKNTHPLAYVAESDKYLDIFYFIKKLDNYCTSLIYKSIWTVKSEMIFDEQLLNKIKELKEEPAISIYLAIIELWGGQNPKKELEELKKLIHLNFIHFNREELQSFYVHAQNFCAAKINQGNLEFYFELFSLYRIQIEQDLILENNTIHQAIYKNIITVGLKVNETDWIENFIKEYTSKLPPNFQDNALNYNLARVYSHEKKYEKVIEQLREVEYKNLIYALGGKLLLIKTYYELKEHKALDSLIDSFRIYLRRNQLISKEVQQQYMNALRFVKRLASLAPYDEKGFKKVKEQINNCKALAAKKWLLEKVKERE